MTFSGLQPFDLGGGVFGLSIQTNGATRMAGFQLQSAVPEPSTILTCALCALLLLTASAARRREAKAVVIRVAQTPGLPCRPLGRH